MFIEKVCDFHEKRYMQAMFPIGSNPDSRPCPGARLVEREVVRDGRTVWVEEWRVTVSSVGELLELQSGLGAPVLLRSPRSASSSSSRAASARPSCSRAAASR